VSDNTKKRPVTLPKSTHLSKNISDGNLDQMVAEVRRKAWLRNGKFHTVQRLRHDKGFAKSVVELAMENIRQGRAVYFRDAMNCAIRNRLIFERDLREGKGISFVELDPLTPQERTHLLKELKKMWDIPEQLQRPVVQ
jgi:hypothetical protein